MKNVIPKNKVIAIVISSVLLYTIAILLWQQQQIDSFIVIKHNLIYEDNFLPEFFRMVSHYGMSFIALVYALLLFLSFRNEDFVKYRLLFLIVLFSFATGGIAGDLLKFVFERARPAVALSGQIAQTYISKSPSFPSGHAAKAMSLVLPFILLAVQKDVVTTTIKIVLSLAALLVCYSRIALQSHYLSDVIAGAGTALIFILSANWMANRIYRIRKFEVVGLESFSKRLTFIFIALAIILSIL